MPELLKFIDAEKIPGDLYVRSQQIQATGFAPPGLSFLRAPPVPGQLPGPPPVEQEVKPKLKKEGLKKQQNSNNDDDDAGLD